MRHATIPALVLAALALGVPVAAAAPLNRPDDPVVVTGAGTPALVGAPPSDVVAFAWTGAWQQIPVQVDERKLFDLRSAYPSPFSCGGNGLCYSPFSTPAKLRYADPGTLVGADADPALDANDEIAFMAKDTGSEAGTVPDPAGVAPGSRVLVKVADSLDGGVGYAYLFRRTAALDPSAGQQYVNYTFSLTSGAYPATYRFAAGTNTETSTVVTPRYSRAFIDRWRETGLSIGGSGPDILDRAENQFSPDYCGRSTLTFAGGEGAFLVNRNGPVRAIRAFLGANSGPMTERQQVFYEGREEDTTYLRVHPIPGVMSFMDYSAAASGMTYRNNNNLAGVTIDGVADTVTPGALTWESVDGSQGALTSVHTWNTSVAASKFTSFYRDAASPPAGQTPCQGDAGFYGAGGPFVNGSINSTDEPSNGNAPSDRLTTTRTMFFGAPGSANGPLRRSQVTAPLTTNLDPPPVVVPPVTPRPTLPAPTPPGGGVTPPKAKPRVKLSLGLRYHRARGCARRAAVLTVKGKGLGQVLRVGLASHAKTRIADRARPFRIAITKKRLHGHPRGLVVIRARLAGGRLVTLKHRVRELC